MFYFKNTTIENCYFNGGHQPFLNQVQVRPNTNHLLANESNNNSEDIFKNCVKNLNRNLKNLKHILIKN